MSFIKYLKENIKLFVFYILLITFISLTIYCDRKNRVLASNLIYIVFVSIFIFIIYIIHENLKATGIGLYLSQKLAKKLNHYITLESEYKRGTKAIIHFTKWNDYYEVTKM